MEIVTLDCALMEMYEMKFVDEFYQGEQVLAVIIRPATEPLELLEKKGFSFCGYDLVEMDTTISAITNCGAEFDKSIRYNRLNSYGLISTYKEAVYTQLALQEEYPDENHAYCEVVEMWRKVRC